MCLIVDANVATQVFSPDPSPDLQPVWEAISTGHAVAVHGGELTEEYGRIASLRNLLLELERQGKVRQVPHQKVREATDRFRNEGTLRSDDPHILAVARVGNVRLLCSHDTDLHADFTNPSLLQPAGSVYQRASHKHLIRKHCGRPKKTRKRTGKTRSRTGRKKRHK